MVSHPVQNGFASRLVVVCVMCICFCFPIEVVGDKEHSGTAPVTAWNEKYNASWLLFANGPDTTRDLRAMPYIGNGYLASLCGYESHTVFINGLYNGPALDLIYPSHRAGVPLCLFHYRVRGIGTKACALDMETASYHCHASNFAKTIFVDQVWVAHRKRRSLAYLQMNITNTASTSQRVCLDLPDNSDCSQSRDLDLLEFTCHDNHDPPYCEFVQQIKTPEGGDSEPKAQVAAIWTYTAPKNSCFDVGGGETVSFRYVFLVKTSVRYDGELKGQDLLAALHKQFAQVQEQSDAYLWQTHTREWQELWESSIDVAPGLLARLVRSSTYYILSSIRSDFPYSLSPGSLSTNGYNGHVFWDTEIWMLPALLPFHPELVKSALQYRMDRTEGATLKAKSYPKERWRGFMYPWESASLGIETCPTFAPTGQLEHHISADIVLAFKQYYSLTGDRRFIHTKAWPVLKGICEFLSSRAEKNKDGSYSINGIIPADEFAVDVDDAPSTNAAFALALAFCIDVATESNRNVPKDWIDVASNLRILYDPKRNVHPEFLGYRGNKRIKQADVVLLAFPLEFPIPESTRHDDLYYYEPRVFHHGPTMTQSMETIGWLDVGNSSNAVKSFKRSHKNAMGDYLVWRETPRGGAGHFITGAGGFLQAVTYGWGGLRIHTDKILFNPPLVSIPGSDKNNGWIRFRGIRWQGALIDVTRDNKGLLLEVHSAGNVTVICVTDDSGRLVSMFSSAYHRHGLRLPLGKFEIGTCAIHHRKDSLFMERVGCGRVVNLSDKTNVGRPIRPEFKPRFGDLEDKELMYP